MQAMKKFKLIKNCIVAMLCVAVSSAFWGLSASAASEFTSRKDFSWGINGHNFYYKSYPLRSFEQQIDLAAELGVQIYRINLNPKTPSDYEYLDSVVDLCSRYDMQVLLVMDDNTSSPDILRTRYKTIATRYNGKNGHGTIPYIQVFNEVDIWCMTAKDFSDKPKYEGNGTDAAHYSKQALEHMLPNFKAAIEGLKAGNPNCKAVINISYTHTYLFDYLKQNGVTWDITGLDWYANMRDGDYDWILNRLQTRYPQDIFICETNIWPFNPQKESDYENDTVFLPNAMRHVYKNFPRVKAMIFYELLDEPAYEMNSSYDGESHFGFVKVDKNLFSIGNKKPIYHQVQRMLGGGPKEPKPASSDGNNSSSGSSQTGGSGQTSPSSGSTSKPPVSPSNNVSNTSSADSSADSSSVSSESATSEPVSSADTDGKKDKQPKKETKESKVPIWPFIAGGVVLSAVAAVITFVIHKKHSLKEKPEGEE